MKLFYSYSLINILCCFNFVRFADSEFSRKYPLCGYILGVLTHTTALNQLWGGDGTLIMWF